MIGLCKIYPMELSSCHQLKYSHPFKLKLYDLIDFIGWNIKGYTTSGCKDLGILKHYSLWQWNPNPFWFVVLYSATFKLWDFIQLSLICITISKWFFIYFLQQWSFLSISTKSPTFFLINVPVLTFLLVRRLYQSDVCTSPSFVKVRRLYQSDICKSDVCTVRTL